MCSIMFYFNTRKRPATAYCHCNKHSFNSEQQNEQLASAIGATNILVILKYGGCDTQVLQIKHNTTHSYNQSLFNLASFSIIVIIN